MRKIGAIIALICITGVCLIIGGILAQSVRAVFKISEDEFFVLFVGTSIFMGTVPFRYVFYNIFEEFKK